MSLRYNPQFDPPPASASNVEETPQDRVSGDEPMTGVQASCLKILSEQAREPDAYDETLTEAEASQRIDALKAKVDKEQEGGSPRPG